MPPREPLLLLPGTSCDARLWRPVLERLEGPLDGREVSVPIVDGATTTPDLAALLLQRAPPRFALAGFSLGGIVGLEMTAQAPERITRLALIATTPRPDPEPNWARRRAAVAAVRRDGFERWARAELLPVALADVATADPAIGDLIVAMARDLGADVFARQSEVAIHRADSRPRLAAIAVPTLVLCGAQDRLCTPEIHRALAAAIPSARLAILEGCGHFAPLERPDAVARHLGAWLSDAASPAPASVTDRDMQR